MITQEPKRARASKSSQEPQRVSNSVRLTWQRTNLAPLQPKQSREKEVKTVRDFIDRLEKYHNWIDYCRREMLASQSNYKELVPYLKDGESRLEMFSSLCVQLESHLEATTLQLQHTHQSLESSNTPAVKLAV